MIFSGLFLMFFIALYIKPDLDLTNSSIFSVGGEKSVGAPAGLPHFVRC